MDNKTEITGNSVESESGPRVLYRAFSVDPRTLTPEFFTKTLVPGRRNEKDSSKIGDGNEFGVYMSTNRTMSETAYATTPIKGLSIPTERFNSRGGITNNITLPVCGVVVEIDTKGLDIRRPKLLPVYEENNRFQGQEWIADEVPPENYKVVSLRLATHPNDRQRFIVDINNEDPESLTKGIEQIQQMFDRRFQEAQEYANFIKSLDPKERFNEFTVERKWQALQVDKQKKTV